MPLSCNQKRVGEVFFLVLESAGVGVYSAQAVGRETFEPDSAFGIASFVFSVLVFTVAVATTVAGLKRLHGEIYRYQKFKKLRLRGTQFEV